MKIRTLIGKISILALAAFAVPFLNERSALADPLPATFFCHNWNRTNQSDIPSVPFGGFRLWDSGVAWGDIQYNGSNTNYYWFGVLDRWLAEAQAGNYDVLYTFGHIPTWETNGVYFPKDFNNGNHAWKAFVTNLVQHSLNSTTAHIKYYEVWNEPDLTANWGSTTSNLVIMAQQAYSIIHSLDTNALVVGPGWSSADAFGSPTSGIIGYYAEGGAAYQDIVGFHLYLYSGSPASFPGNPQSAQRDINTLNSPLKNGSFSGASG